MIPGTILAPSEVHTVSEIAGTSVSTPSAPRDAGEAPRPVGLCFAAQHRPSVHWHICVCSAVYCLFLSFVHLARVLPDWCVRVNLNLLPIPLWLVCLSACYPVLFTSVCYPVIYSLVSMCVLTCRLTYSLSLGGVRGL